MRGSLFYTALLGATAFASQSSCENQIRNSGIEPRQGDRMVTIVQVADRDNTLRYFPENIRAPVGSIVQFQFNPRNHTVTESSFDQPCRALAANGTSQQRPGQRSGFVPVTPQDTDIKVFNVLVNDTRPIWIFCGQANHCQQGMSMVINEPQNDPSRTLIQYKANARLVPAPPGVAAPPGIGATGAGFAASPIATPNPASTGTNFQSGAAIGASNSTRPLNAADARSAPLYVASFGAIIVASIASIL